MDGPRGSRTSDYDVYSTDYVIRSNIWKKKR